MIRQLATQIRIGNVTIPALSWQCHLTSYGNLCTFEVQTSIQQLKKINYAIFQQQQNNFTLECQIILLDNTAGTSQIVFDGIIDTVEGIWEEDLIEITGRDYSAVLRDKDDTLDKYINQTVSQVITGIATDNNILASVDSASQIAGIRASTFQGEDWAMSTSPRPTWHIIQQLADEVGYVAYMDQHKTLHFTTPGSGQSHTYYWRPTGPDALNPIMNLSITQQSRRCSNFTLRVHGYDVSGKETIYKDVVRGSGTGHFYNKSRQDLTAQNCDQIANNIADEILRKNLVVKMIVEGDTALNVNDKMQILESQSQALSLNSTQNDLLGLSNSQLYITSVLHSFTMPDYGSEEGSGFLTHVTCNQLTQTSA